MTFFPHQDGWRKKIMDSWFALAALELKVNHITNEDERIDPPILIGFPIHFENKENCSASFPVNVVIAWSKSKKIDLFLKLPFCGNYFCKKYELPPHFESNKIAMIDFLLKYSDLLGYCFKSNQPYGVAKFKVKVE